jgi:hypothetical protein
MEEKDLKKQPPPEQEKTSLEGKKRWKKPELEELAINASEGTLNTGGDDGGLYSA